MRRSTRRVASISASSSSASSTASRSRDSDSSPASSRGVESSKATDAYFAIVVSRSAGVVIPASRSPEVGRAANDRKPDEERVRRSRWGRLNLRLEVLRVRASRHRCSLDVPGMECRWSLIRAASRSPPEFGQGRQKGALASGGARKAVVSWVAMPPNRPRSGRGDRTPGTYFSGRRRPASAVAAVAGGRADLPREDGHIPAYDLWCNKRNAEYS